jgi:hypothetical protein
MWQTIVIEYTKAKLTWGKDKLIAISGLAHGAYQETGSKDEYLAGIGRSNMEGLLCWKRAITSDEVERPLVYRAPSWSWASINSPVFPGV